MEMELINFDPVIYDFQPTTFFKPRSPNQHRTADA